MTFGIMKTRFRNRGIYGIYLKYSRSRVISARQTISGDKFARGGNSTRFDVPTRAAEEQSGFYGERNRREINRFRRVVLIRSLLILLPRARARAQRNSDANRVIE